MPIFVATKQRNVMDRVKVMNGICRMIEKNYSGTSVPFGGIDLSKDGDYLILKVKDMKERNMPYCAKRIFEKCPEIRMVHFTGGWVEHVYSRESLKWAGIKVSNKKFGN
jgi:hypothetical protein